MDTEVAEDAWEVDIPVIDVDEVLVCRLTASFPDSHDNNVSKHNGQHASNGDAYHHNSQENEKGAATGYASLSLTSVAWDPLQPGRLATGCSDGVVLLWDIAAHLQQQVRQPVESEERGGDKIER